MFDRSDLEVIEKEQLTHWQTVGSYPGLHYTIYPQHAFRIPDSEESIRITRAPKKPQDNGIKFWLSAEWADDWRGRESYFSGYVRQAKFERISEEEFNTAVLSHSNELIVPFALPLHSTDGFIGALLMYSMKTDSIVSLLAEYEDELIHFYWETTA